MAHENYLHDKRSIKGTRRHESNDAMMTMRHYSKFPAALSTVTVRLAAVSSAVVRAIVVRPIVVRPIIVSLTTVSSVVVHPYGQFSCCKPHCYRPRKKTKDSAAGTLQRSPMKIIGMSIMQQVQTPQA